MKKLFLLPLVILAATFVARADDVTTSTNKPVKPDLLKTCPVSGDKLGGDMGEPVVFTYKDQEVKLCCKGCKKDFDKNPAKYMKKIRKADKTENTGGTK